MTITPHAWHARVTSREDGRRCALCFSGARAGIVEQAIDRQTSQFDGERLDPHRVESRLVDEGDIDVGARQCNGAHGERLPQSPKEREAAPIDQRHIGYQPLHAMTARHFESARRGFDDPNRMTALAQTVRQKSRPFAWLIRQEKFVAHCTADGALSWHDSNPPRVRTKTRKNEKERSRSGRPLFNRITQSCGPREARWTGIAPTIRRHETCDHVSNNEERGIPVGVPTSYGGATA